RPPESRAVPTRPPDATSTGPARAIPASAPSGRAAASGPIREREALLVAPPSAAATAPPAAAGVVLRPAPTLAAKRKAGPARQQDSGPDQAAGTGTALAPAAGPEPARHG